MKYDKEIMFERGWFLDFCNNNEIDRIINPKTPNDYLLSQRANIIADNSRYYRVYLKKARLIPNWSFENSFETRHYTNVISNLSYEDKISCKEITYGDIFSNDANGYAENNKQWGKIIYLNECLKFYMLFCNLALLDFDEDVPNNIRINALRIAIRTMMKNEAMDFFLDPRGSIPESIAITIHELINRELQFVVGHEFSHHLCKHFNDNLATKKAVLSIGENNYYKTVYTVSQKQEFEADLSSINRPLYSRKDYSEILKSALIWLISLSLSETAQEIIAPSSSLAINTHPSAKERFEYLLNNLTIPKDFNTDSIEKILERSCWLRTCLSEDISLNYDLYDNYGSAYLDAPNTRWRGKELIDRVDY